MTEKSTRAWNSQHRWRCHPSWTWDNLKGSASLVRASQSHRTHALKFWSRLLLSNHQQLNTRMPTCDPGKLANTMHPDPNKCVLTYLSDKYLLSPYSSMALLGQSIVSAPHTTPSHSQLHLVQIFIPNICHLSVWKEYDQNKHPSPDIIWLWGRCCLL